MGQALTILFVEDDRQVRSVITEALSQRGFHMLATDNGYEAMRILAQEHVDVLFADVVMPGLNGIELAKQAKLLRPDLKIILATGYFSRATEARSVAKLLFKPLRADQIEAEIRNLMAIC
ncbi:MAG TPA: response regulator [Stellaceae bacterium]